MPLTGSETVAKAALRAAILSADCGAIDGDALTNLVAAIVDTLFAHIVTNATVSPVGLPVPLTAPPGIAGGPVLGVGSIT